MSRYDAASDFDYYDEPWNKPEPCATRGCPNDCDVPSASSYCYWCRSAELVKRAEANEQHRKELAQSKGSAA